MEIIKIPAIPPEDYKGTQACWLVELQTRGLWDPAKIEWHGDLEIDEKEFWQILNKCEHEHVKVDQQEKV